MDHAYVLAETRPRVELSANYAGREYTWQGEIVRTEAEIDMKSRMVHFIARVDNDAQETPLAVGLYVEAEIAGNPYLAGDAV